MASDYLTTDEFDRWAQHNDKQIERVIGEIRETRAKVEGHSIELAVLKTVNEKHARTTKSWSTAVSALVSAIVTGIFQAVRGH